MAISRVMFEKGNFSKRTYSRTDHPVYKFLAEHQDQAFTIKEIRKHVKMQDTTIRSMLRSLMKKDGLIQHKTPYWAIKHRKRR